MRTLLIGACCLLLLVGGVRAEDEAKPMPDFASMDKEVLVVMCEQLYKRADSGGGGRVAEAGRSDR